MSTLTSGKTHRDPLPWLSDASGLRYRLRPDDGFSTYIYAPRPEYDNHNPILAAFRQEWNRADILRDLVLTPWLAAIDAFDGPNDSDSPEYQTLVAIWDEHLHRDERGRNGWHGHRRQWEALNAAHSHAGRVLRKLAALSN